eukprot:Blabericola_migrator_1__12209@NODE_758_length_6631_cov_135_724863_g542_i0_p3_GENE_NODE_758_length_6631_cov_135_724863_g542_i0NODE_758_length_6631_cov_135_724863_g542_i0_p3_ORF_typecomplete_len379_score73_17NPV_P10/PF05531_12/0_82NPV_P10/PF05531_12/4_5e03NPV_P10/PF05531_12/4_5e03BLOC1_2/PF10046_9/0_55BLOC1_2/PF10046_9/7_1e03_NODE_758_length_6631_cov_135_724863_g542_i0791215
MHDKDGSSSEEDEGNESFDLTSAFGQLVQKAKALAQQHSPSAEQVSETQTNSNELDALFGKLDAWSMQGPVEERNDIGSETSLGNAANHSRNTQEPSESPDKLEPPTRKLSSLKELPKKGLLERWVDAVDNLTGGGKATVLEGPPVPRPEPEQSLVRLFSRPDSKKSDKPMTVNPDDQARLEKRLSRSSDDEGQKGTAVSFLASWFGRKSSSEDGVLKPKRSDASTPSIAPQHMSLTKSDTEHAPATPRPSPNTVATTLNFVDNLVTQIRLSDNAEKDRVEETRRLLMSSPRGEPSSANSNRLSLSSQSTRKYKHLVRVKRIRFGPEHQGECQTIAKILRAMVSDDDWVLQALDEICSRLDGQFAAVYKAARGAKEDM